MGDTAGPLGISDFATPEISAIPSTKVVKPAPTIVGQKAAATEVEPDVVVDGKKQYTGDLITDVDYEAAAAELGCEAEVLKAIGYKESEKLRNIGVGAFDGQNRPTILYERHVFSEYTSPPRRYDGEHPDISGLKPYVKGTLRDPVTNKPQPDNDHYGLFSWQYSKLAKAYVLDSNAALQACSWGKFQIMGFNFGTCGYASAREFVLDMCVSEKKHLAALIGFCRGDTLKNALKKRDWAMIAATYNGPNYKNNNYDTDLETYYNQLKSGTLKIS